MPASCSGSACMFSTNNRSARRVPSPSNVSTAEPGSSGFFGRGEQAFLDQTFRVSFDLFHGDASFKPVDWRIRITPEVSLNNLKVRELGIVGPSPLSGTNRLDSHLGLQEAFVEYKIHDLSVNYDFVSIRAGIQEFNADFRGLAARSGALRDVAVGKVTGRFDFAANDFRTVDDLNGTLEATLAQSQALELPVLPYLDLTCLGLGIFLVCGRQGCLMVGCCHGKPCGWGIGRQSSSRSVRRCDSTTWPATSVKTTTLPPSRLSWLPGSPRR